MTESSILSFADGPAVPDMVEALLNEQDLQALMHDLASLTVIQSIISKGGARQHAPAETMSLEAACDALRSRTVMAIQIRYQFESQDWTDTLMQTPQGIKLVRCLHPAEYSD